MRRALASMSALMVVIGCGEESREKVPQPATTETPAPVRDRPSEVEMVAAMEAHYEVVILAHDALLQGDLERFRSQLALALDRSLPATSPEAWLPFHEKLRDAARGGANVADLDGAASTLAEVVLACGTCHAALGTGPIYPTPAPDDGDTIVESAMREHQWATERLWEGVTGPWDDAWERGANSLAASQTFADANPDLILTDELQRRDQALREIGAEAALTTELDERAALYGRLLATCGGCHQLIGVRVDGN